MAVHAVIRARHDDDGDVVAVGYPGADWSPRSKQAVIGDIESGIHRYYVPWTDGQETLIRVVNGPTGKYLRTDRDKTAWNNLDDLPEC